MEKRKLGNDVILDLSLVEDIGRECALITVDALRYASQDVAASCQQSSAC